jgi:hypothetical protein
MNSKWRWKSRLRGMWGKHLLHPSEVEEIMYSVT